MQTFIYEFDIVPFACISNHMTKILCVGDLRGHNWMHFVHRP